MSLSLQRFASSTLLAILCVGGLDGAIVYLTAVDASIGLLWRASTLSSTIALVIVYLLIVLRSLIDYAYPKYKQVSLATRVMWFLISLIGSLIVLASVQWSLRWAHAHLKRVEYQALWVGGIVLGVLLLLGLLAPIFARFLSKIGQNFLSMMKRVTQDHDWIDPALAIPPEKSSFILATCLLLVSCVSLSSAPTLWEPLSTLSVEPLYLLVWSLWIEGGVVPMVSRASPRKILFSLGSLSLFVVVIGIGSNAYQLSSREAQLITQRGTWAPYALSLGRHLTDWDHDGRSSLFADGDCQAKQPKIRPGAYEPIGRDLNCDGIKRERMPSWSKTLRAKTAEVLLDAQGQSTKHLILITIDALRADAFERWMPKTLAFTKKAVRFTHGYSTGAATYWSIPALIGSKPPSAFTMERDQTPARQERLLFEVLQDRGFHTALLANVTIFFVRGLSQGAHTKNYETSRFTQHGARPGAAHMTTNILTHVDLWRSKKLKPHRDRLALWAHYYDPHEPYFEIPDQPFASDEVRYQATIQALDQSLSDLFEGLQTRGMLEETTIVFTSDHGDEFGEHGGRHHGRTLYEEMVHVPLWIYSPHLKAQILNRPISHIDVAPSILSLLNLPSEPAFMGVSWLSKQPLLEAAFFEVLPDQNYGAELVGLVSKEGWKLIYDLSHNSFELYRLTQDPKEERDLSAWLTGSRAPLEHQTRLQELKKALLSFATERIVQLAKGKAQVRKPWGSPKN